MESAALISFDISISSAFIFHGRHAAAKWRRCSFERATTLPLGLISVGIIASQYVIDDVTPPFVTPYSITSQYGAQLASKLPEIAARRLLHGPGERRRQSRTGVRENRKLGFPSVTSRRPCDSLYVCETSGSRTWTCPSDNTGWRLWSRELCVWHTDCSQVW